MKKIIFILINIFSFLNAQNSEYGMNIAVGYNSYNLNDLKEFLYYNGKLYHDNNIPVSVKNAFPNSISGRFEFYILNGIGKPPFGFFVEYYSTPGTLQFDSPQLSSKLQFSLYSISLGVIGEKSLLHLKNGTLLLQLRPSILFNYLGLNESVSIIESSSSQDLLFQNISLGAALILSYKTYINDYSVQPYFGYQITTSQPLHLKNKSAAKLKNYDGSDISAQWSGFRLGVTMGIEW